MAWSLLSPVSLSFLVLFFSSSPFSSAARPPAPPAPPPRSRRRRPASRAAAGTARRPRVTTTGGEPAGRGARTRGGRRRRPGRRRALSRFSMGRVLVLASVHGPPWWRTKRGCRPATPDTGECGGVGVGGEKETTKEWGGLAAAFLDRHITPASPPVPAVCVVVVVLSLSLNISLDLTHAQPTPLSSPCPAAPPRRPRWPPAWALWPRETGPPRWPPSGP